MHRLSSSLPSPAMLVALLALFVALGGSAYAVKTTTAAPANSVITKSIKKGAVTRLKLADGAVGASQLLPGAVGAPQMANGAVGTAQIADGAITGVKVGTKALTASNIDLSTLGIPKPTVYTERRATAQHTFEPEGSFQLLVECLPGETATGGGGRSSNGRIALAESIPFSDSTGQRWGVLLHNPTKEALSEQVSAYVICASA
jgi:hypothetical protein